MSEHDYGVAVEDQDELDAVRIEECGEPLVDFLEYCPLVVLSPRHPVFEFPRVHLLRLSVARMLKEASESLPAGLKLEIVEGYRPVEVQHAMFRHALEEARKRFPGASEERIRLEAGRYSAPPDAKSPPPHFTGGAVDLHIVQEDLTPLDFSSPFELTDLRAAAMHAAGLSAEAEANRALLREVLEPTGLTNYADEWWHWSYGDNGWALRVGAPAAIYGAVAMPADAHWVGDLKNLPPLEG